MVTLIGLGNPGEKYANNRHNVGHLFIDYLLEQSQKETQPQKTKKSNLYVCYIFDKLSLCKTRTYMNESGKAIQKILQNKKSKIQDTRYKIQSLFVAHDDLDIPLGKFKIQKGVGPKLHNGIKSIEQYLHTKNFWRVRIGVDNRIPSKKIEGEKYVLSNFSSEEKDKLKAVFPILQNQLYSLMPKKEQSS